MTTRSLSAARATVLGLFALSALSGVLGAQSTPVLAGTAPIYTSRFSRLALAGFDPVAYFLDGKPSRALATSPTPGRVRRGGSPQRPIAMLLAPLPSATRPSTADIALGRQPKAMWRLETRAIGGL